MHNTFYKNRIWEIDFLRGIAILLMVFFHIIYDLSEFYNYSLDYSSGFYFWVGKIAAILFISLTAISCSFSKNNKKRAFKILAAALLISLGTYFYDRLTYINFGILHFIGVSILLYSIVKDLNLYLLSFLGAGFIVLGLYLNQLNANTELLFAFGYTSSNYASLDYYPLFPYFGVFLYGIVFRRLFYPERISLFTLDWSQTKVVSIGKQSLLIYLIHQPIILVVLYLLNQIGLV